MNILVIDIGGTHVKVLASGQTECREFDSGPRLTPRKLLAGVKALVADWSYDVISIGFPGPVLRNRPVAEPHNLGRGWVGFDFAKAFGCPVQVVNDAAMQALGSYRDGTMLFLGLGTGLGSAMIVDGKVEPMELGHLPYKKGTYEDYVEEAWRIVDPVLKSGTPVFGYAPGNWGPAEAETRGRPPGGWHNPVVS
jgi:polyphosphate glucokinase